LEKQIGQASASYALAAKELKDLNENYQQLGFRLLVGLSIGLLLVAVLSLVLAVARSAERARPYYVAGIGSVTACVLAVLGCVLLNQLDRETTTLTAQVGETKIAKGPEAKRDRRQVEEEADVAMNAAAGGLMPPVKGAEAGPMVAPRVAAPMMMK